MSYVFLESFYANWPRRSRPQPTVPTVIYLDPNYKYYRVLGLEQNASRAAIKQAYRRRVLETHPDKGGKESEFRIVQEAYEVLSRVGGKN